jgi:hypothetical protein
MFKRLAVIFFLLIALGLSSYSQEEKYIALSMYNFTRLIDWPASEKGGDFIIDVIGHKSVYEKLTELTTGRKVGTQDIIVRYLESTANISNSQILFVGFWQSKDLPKVIEKVNNAHTLIITEKEGMIDLGSGINFIIVNNAIKFEIGPANTEKYGIRVGESLLKLAYKVY